MPARYAAICSSSSYAESVAPSHDAIEVLERLSPPLANAVKRAPHILDANRAEDSLGLRVAGALARTVVLDFIAGAGLTSVTRSLSDEFDGIVRDELRAATVDVAEKLPEAEAIPFAIVAMGKWGSREVNYYSDLDLIFVHDHNGDGAQERRVATAIASRFIARLTTPTFDGPNLNIDVDLRPEGSMGPLTRSLEGYTSYYHRWSEGWELQALLKARPVAGDPSLGDRFQAMADRIIWEGGLDEESLRAIRRIKAMAEETASPGDIKRGRGGIRDIEFAIQLLQLVHGRFDQDLRVTPTLEALEALASHGYIAPAEANDLADAYDFLRRVEHVLQLRELRQTHTLPRARDGLDQVGRALGFEGDPAAALEQRLTEVRGVARDLHERLYFRPILDSLVGVEGSIDPSEARIRLEALGYKDVVAAAKAVSQLTTGLSRRSRVMHQALPLMLDWLSRSPDPDLGLAQLRLLLARTPDHAGLVGLLQNNPLAGERLCTLLGSGRLIGDLIDRIPEFIPRLADDASIADVRPGADAADRLLSRLDSRPDIEDRIGTIRRFVRRRKLRIAARDVLENPDPATTLLALTETADAAVESALHALDAADTSLAVVAMGKWGGRELSYGSDLDLVYLNAEGDTDRAIDIAVGLRRVLSDPSRHGDAFQVDEELRPEGRKGPLSRSIDSYARYLEEWAEPWELMALVKARPVAGNEKVLEAFSGLVSDRLWGRPFSDSVAREIRRIKARVETERIPPSEDPDFHLKLGPGGLSDVEFAVQLMQLQHGAEHEGLRVTGTLEALEALSEVGLLTGSQGDALRASYIFCTRTRMRLQLQKGRQTDSLPTDPDEAGRLAASLGLGRTSELREQYRRHTRRARRAFEEVFFA